MFDNLWQNPPFRSMPEEHLKQKMNPCGARRISWAAVVGLACLLIAALAGCAPSAGTNGMVPVTGGAAMGVREYPLVEQSQDNPTHLAFQEHVRRAVLAQRQAMNFPRAADQLEAQNQSLEPFGFHLEASHRPPFSGYTLYYRGEPLRDDIARFWPVSIKNATPNQERDFLLPFLTLSGEKLVASATGVKPWPGQVQEGTSPAADANRLAYAQAEGGLASLAGGQGLLDIAPEPTPARYVWGPTPGSDRHWAIELDGSVIIDGQNMNEIGGYEQVFGFQVINGEPLYFYVKDGITHLHYADKDLPYVYDQVIHHNSGPLQVFNPGSAGNLVWFYALRDGLWYYVEAGTIE